MMVGLLALPLLAPLAVGLAGWNMGVGTIRPSISSVDSQPLIIPPRGSWSLGVSRESFYLNILPPMMHFYFSEPSRLKLTPDVELIWQRYDSKLLGKNVPVFLHWKTGFNLRFPYVLLALSLGTPLLFWAWLGQQKERRRAEELAALAEVGR
jgi:hypothetical protein